MIDILDKIRKPSIFILLLILNSWLFWGFVFDSREELVYMLMVLFFFLSFDYSGLRKDYMYWLLIFVAITILDFNSHKLNVLAPIVLMQCACRLDIRTYLLYNIIIQGGTAVVMFILEGTGRMYASTGLDLFRIRYDFGFGHPNAAAMYYWGLFVSLVLYLYLSVYRKLLWLFLLLILVFSFFLYSETTSRSFLISVLTFAGVYCYYQLRLRLRRGYVIGYSRYIIYILPIAMTVITLYFGIYANEYPILDILLSMRLRFFNDFLNTLTPMQCLLGSDAFDSIIVDSSYLHLLFESGILLFVFFIWIYYPAIKNIVRQQNFLLIAILVSFLVYGLSESLLLLPMIIGNNLFWVLLYKYQQGEDESFKTDSNLIDA